MSNDLTQLRCQPLEGQPALNAAETAAYLARVAGWSVIDGAIEKCFRFADYPRTIGFVNAVALIAEREDHHPDLQVSWGRVTVRFNTHSVGGLSINDFICAAKLDALRGA